MEGVGKIYVYEKCSTCKKTLEIIKNKGLLFEVFPIREAPPSFEELKFMLNQVGGKISKMLNTGSFDYREQKELISKMSDENIFKLLRENGNLIKRPFVLMNGQGWVGHQESRFE